MAIVRANYTKSRSKIKATLRYIIHRPGREGEKLTRVLFGHDGELRKEEAYQFIDAQKGMTYFHLKINFHPKREDRRKDLDLQEITKNTITTLEKRLQRPIRFLAVEHDDHSPLRHIHAIAMLKLERGERIGKQDWKACRDAATHKALYQRLLYDHIYKNLYRTQQKILYARTREPSVRALFRHACPNCGAGQEMKRYRNEFVCRNCGYRQERKRRWSMELGL